MDRPNSVDLVRELLKKHGYYRSEDICVDEGKSADSRINTLLAVIPPELSTKRYPDFLMRIKDQPHFLIVVESRMGEGAVEKNPNEDGTMLYSAALAQKYDVLTIAIREVSGGQYRIEHFLQKKGEGFYRRMFGNRLLSLAEYLEGVQRAPKESRPVCAKLIVGHSPKKGQAVRAVVRTELYLMPPKFAHRFMENHEINMVRRTENE
ncbi:MAG: hypothetical protein IIX92_05795 [Selenomonadales bacterium]|jgi:hypothetical protein|nr:hypothetical protein [Selenomonadales bacterium]MBQ2113957.1 hypothetical protein [Selenomonadales bacterium]MBQ2246275.1 hypothetical protein [Selenomonadales bacterium]MBQ5588308.1 hypothetical protein [Selenomonadales bacterium]MBQ5637162.1 hypothetical protein [Selenomonadales bacterium]